MHQFRILKTGEIKTAFSLREEGEKTYVKFSKDGKEYGYFTHSSEIKKARKTPVILRFFGLSYA